ncbi:hypothetical protein LC087_01180 [Bacillus carboniphilus]|uniref:Lipoprotein n=1 Tax=Bacillus carboniphilus TaxID=86663 RepID=A0ABY9JU40_9BACI|nr:hypothetical protein [Bacillus carboniphilus]WLR42882.1 hypothetical protein LC087_01180 [Bacillus carboniphilus]
MKKVLVVIFLLLSACGLKPTTFEELYDGDVLKVTKIKTVQFIPEDNQEKQEGYLYWVMLFEGKEESIHFSTTEVKGNNYFTDLNLNMILEDFYLAIEVIFLAIKPERTFT